MVGSRIGKYRLVRQLGEGGMGVVYEAVREDIAARAAIKVLRPEYAANPELAGRFFNEARAANLIAHPGIVRVFDYGAEEGGIAYLAMEYLDGESLWKRIDRHKKLALPEALRIARQIASALAAAHDKQIVHRDLMLAFFPSPSAQVFLWGESGGKDAVLILFLATDVKREKGNFPS